MVFLDTNVFLYAAGADHPLKEACTGLLARVGSGDLEAATSTEVVQELLYVLTRRGMRAEGLRLARRVMALVPEVLPVTERDMAGACDVMEEYPELPVRDAVHAATMKSNSLQTIVSGDRHFDQVAWLVRQEPSEAE